MAVSKHQGKWRAEVWLKGKRVWSESGFATELEARNAEAEAKENLETINTDFIRLCESRLEELELKRSQGHFRENRTLLKNLIARWGRKKVKREDVEEYLNEVARESKAKANKHLRLVRALFNHGIERGWLKTSPAQGIKRFPQAKASAYIPSEADIRLVLELADCEQRRYLLAVLHSIGRVRSINNLRWDDVHKDFLVLHTRKAKNSDLKEIRVPINSVLRKVLDLTPKVNDWVFPNPRTGKPYDYRDKFLPNLCREAGVRPFMYHALRHYGASKLDNLGVALSDIQALLGHERATTTDHYLQSLRGSTKEAIKKLEDLYA
ncbi:MAG: tyrosine-type recombinase/integrase [Deltaproteobacteria bacterium]|jgi:integrase|nr:tyrosine-type recombinase/integrase [Deltaproteobacteria bacterium]